MFKFQLLSWCLLIFRLIMKPLSNKERQKRGTEKLKNEGKYEDFKKKKAEARGLSRQKQKENMTEKESVIARLKKKKLLEMQKYRLKKKEIPVEAATLSCVNAFGSKSSEAKATNEFQKLYRKV